MEFRVLQYFLAVTREQSISGAAESLHLSQPTLSRQLREMEQELGKQLFIRSNRKITLTQEGMLLRKRAEEITSLVRKTQEEIALSADIAGDVHIGSGETDAVRLIAQAARRIRAEYPRVHFHIASGDTTDVMADLESGLMDFGLIFSGVDAQKYDVLEFPVTDRYGVLMPSGCDLAAKTQIAPEDLWDKPLILNRNTQDGGSLTAWMHRRLSDLNIVATYNLLFNGSMMVQEGLGYAICLEGIVNTTCSSLCFRPLAPEVKAEMRLIWKRYEVLTKAANAFLEEMREIVREHS